VGKLLTVSYDRDELQGAKLNFIVDNHKVFNLGDVTPKSVYICNNILVLKFRVRDFIADMDVYKRFENERRMWSQLKNFEKMCFKELHGVTLNLEIIQAKRTSFLKFVGCRVCDVFTEHVIEKGGIDNTVDSTMINTFEQYINFNYFDQVVIND